MLSSSINEWALTGPTTVAKWELVSLQYVHIKKQFTYWLKNIIIAIDKTAHLRPLIPPFFPNVHLLGQMTLLYIKSLNLTLFCLQLLLLCLWQLPLPGTLGRSTLMGLAKNTCWLLTGQLEIFRLGLYPMLPPIFRRKATLTYSFVYPSVCLSVHTNH